MQKTSKKAIGILASAKKGISLFPVSNHPLFKVHIAEVKPETAKPKSHVLITENSSKMSKLIVFILKILSIITRISCFCFCFFINRKQRQKRLIKIKTRLYKLGILKFFTHLIWVLRVMRTFRERTFFRKLRQIPLLFYMINDHSNFQTLEKTKSYSSTGKIIPIFCKIQINKKTKKLVRKIIKKFNSYLGSEIKLLINLINQNLIFYSSFQKLSLGSWEQDSRYQTKPTFKNNLGFFDCVHYLHLFPFNSNANRF